MMLTEQQEVRNSDPRSWMDDMMNFLLGNGYPQGLDKTKRRYYRLQSIPYVIVEGVLFRKYFNGALLRFLDTDQAESMIKELHDGPDGGHFSARTTAMKFMRAGYYWPSLFHDCHKYVRKCEKCAFFFGKQRLATLPFILSR